MKRIKVFQDGVLVGTVPQPKNEPNHIQAYGIYPEDTNGDALVSFRRTDFQIRWDDADNGWTREAVFIADPMLGMGDLQDIQGFVPADN